MAQLMSCTLFRLLLFQSDGVPVGPQSDEAPVAMRTRSHSSAKKNILSESAAVASSLCSSDGEASGRVDTSFRKHNFAIDQARPLSLVLQLPERLPSVLQHYIDFVVCGEYETTVKIKDIGVFCIIIIMISHTTIP